MYGVEVYYMPRKYVTQYTVIKEVIQSEFDNAYPLEAYVDSYEGYGGQGTLLSKFGIQEKDDLSLIISKERFETYITPLIKNLSNIELATRPKEGDLIYFPLGDRLFEIKYVEHEQPFYQLEKNYVYQLKCELFRLEDEVIDTNVDTIDDEIEQIGHIQTLNLIGSGTTAVVDTVGFCSTGAVQKVYITNMGNNYLTPPVVAFSSAPSGGVTAEGVVTITDQYIGCAGTKAGKVFSVCITNTGCGYTVAPIVTFSGGGGSGAAATTGICTDGSVQFVTLSNAGAGYTSNVNITFPAPVGGGVSAVATGIVNSAGIVTYVCIDNAGCGYTQAPTPSVSDPIGVNTTLGGSFIFNEIVTGQTSGTTSRVKEYDATNNILEISIVDGDYGVGEIIVGQESGARQAVKSINEFDLVTGFADNDNIEAEADSIINFNSKNPFGMP